MKIRITKKGLHKAQYLFSQPDKELQLSGPQQPNYNWTNFNSQAPVVNPNATPQIAIENTGTPVANPQSVMPIKQYKPGEWMNANQSKLTYGINKELSKAENFLNNNKYAQGTMQYADALGSLANSVGNVASMFDTRRKNRDIERNYRESLLTPNPIDYTERRGDYEVNTGMVDPYNSGAKSKGQFTDMFYTPQFQEGGISLGPISFSDEPVRENVYQYATPLYSEPQNKQKETPTNSNGSVRSFSNFNPAAYTDTAKFIKSLEGFTPTAKWDHAQYSIGYGTKAKNKNEVLTKEDAEQRLLQVLNPIVEKIQKRVKVPLNSGQLIALASLNYNTGSLGNKLVDRLNKGEDPKIIANTIKTMALTGVGSDKIIPGLVTRRQKEASLFTRGYQDGGENSETMKIRIIKQPMESMAYGGQSGYGLDLGERNVYTDMPKSKQDTVSNTIGPVPRNQANIEAEQGETIYGDMDGDGFNEHMTIGGKPHYNGGTPLNAPDGSFIYSKKLKEKNSDTLKMFNKTFKKGGVSYSDMAKQYDVNKYKAILQDPNTDSLAKKTAEMMIGNYEKKLGLLAYAQEYSKGFPQGVPAVAQNAMGSSNQMTYGGYVPEMGDGGYLEKYQTKGIVTPRPIPNQLEFQTLINSGKYKQVPGTNNWSYFDKITIPGTLDKTNIIKGTAGKKYIPNENAWWKSLTPAQKAAHNAKKRQELKTNPLYAGTADRTEVIKGEPERTFDETDLITYTDTPSITNPPGTDGGNPGAPGSNPDNSGFNGTNGNVPYGWTKQDINNYALAAKNRAGIKKYSSVRPDFNPVASDFRNMDWRGRAAELQGTYNSQMNTLGTYQSPSSLAANASFMAGQQGENLINRAIDPIEQANVQGYNQVAGQNASIMNQAIANNAQNKFLRSQDRAILNQNYDNAIRDADGALVQTQNQGDTNAAGIYNSNLTEGDNYYIDPRTQKMKFASQNALANFRAMQRGAGANTGNMQAQATAMYNSLNGMPEKLRELYMEGWIRSQFPNSRTGSQTTYPFNPRNNKTVTPVRQTANDAVDDGTVAAYGGYINPWPF